MPAAIPNRTATQIRVNEIVYQKIKWIASLENRNTNAQIEYFLKKAVESYEEEHGTILPPAEQ